jgi:hypothetical protein
VLCLNVLDRHPRPRATVEHFKRLLSTGGLLVIATPYDFHPDATPDKTDWLTDMRELFAKTDWNILGDGELYYEFRLYNRNWTRFSSQVIGVQNTAA